MNQLSKEVDFLCTKKKGRTIIPGITTKPLHFDLELEKKIEFVCNFCNTTPTIINGSIRNIEHTNISYIEPHRVIIKGVTLLAKN